MRIPTVEKERNARSVGPAAQCFVVHEAARWMLRPMRDAVECHLGEAVVRDLLGGGTGCGRLTTELGEDRLWVERMNGQEDSVFRIKRDTC